MRFGKSVTASLMAAMMTLSSVVSPFSAMDVKAEEVRVSETTTQAEESKTLIDLNTQWTYYDSETDPVTTGNDRTAWTKEGFDISSWKTSPEGTEAKFGAKRGELGEADGYMPNIKLNQYKEDGSTDIEAFFFRTVVDVDINEIGEEDLMKGTVIYDDAALVYINGELVAEFDNKQYENESEKFTANMQYGGHNGSTAEASFEVDANILKDGENIIAVELHQGRPSSSDIYFEMPSLGVEEFVAEQKAVSLSVGEDATSRNITWYSNVNEAGTVQYAVKDGETFPEKYEEVTAETADTNDGDFISNKAVMTDLESNTEYVYRLVNGELVSETYSFKTTVTNDFNFLLVGDPQIGASGGVSSDTAGWEDTLNKAMDAFSNSAFLLSAGDQVNTASNEEQYDGYLEHDALTSLPTATIIGNHDSGSDAYTQHFNNPNVTSYGATTAGTDYWYVYNNVLFMHLNSNSGSIAEHRALIKEAVEANPDVDWKVVSFHHSIYSVASHAEDSDILNRRETYVPVFEEFDIDVVLMGHDHVYARSYMMDGHTPIVTDEVESSATDSDGILYITANSASGSKFYGISGEYEYAAVQSQERVPNISNVEVTENSFKITTYRTTDMSVVDEFTVNKSAKIAGETKTESVSAADGMENTSAALAITKTAQYNSGIVNEDGGSAEIVKYNSDNHMYYVVNGTSGTLDIVPRDTEKIGVKLNIKRILEDKYPGFSYGDMTSVDVCEDKELIAVAVQAEGTNEEGKVVFLDYDNEIVKVVTVGVQPDMLTFTKNGKKVLVANEGEPRDGYDGEAADPQGSISIIDLNNINGATVKTVTFEDWDEKREQLVENGVIIKKNTAPSVDFEPEFIAVNEAGTKAYVALQEANAIATLDVKTGKITDIQSLGFKNHNLAENALDMMKDDAANIKTENAYGIYMPDGIAAYEADGKTYILTANEGDSREWGNYLNEKEVEINGNEVVIFDTTDYDGVDADKTYLFGARSFAIYDAETMEQVYESGSDFEEKTLAYFPKNFNCSNDKNKLDNRSGKKGPEAESVVTGVVGDKTYAFIGLERIGGVMVYDITDPAKAAFVNYINTRDFSEKIAGDVSPEGLCFVEASESFSQNAELIVANEVSGTVAIYEMTAKKVEDTNKPSGDDTTQKPSQDTSAQAPSEDTTTQKPSDTTQAVVVPLAPAKVSATLYSGYDDVKVNWTKVTGAVGYNVYYKLATAKKYRFLGGTTRSAMLARNLANGKKYTFKVVPYYMTDGKQVEANASKTASVTTLKRLNTPKVAKYSSGKVKVRWNNISGETGYQISVSTKRTKTSIKATVKSSTAKSKVLKVTKGKKYYYKVRAYKTVNGKKIYGQWSKVKSFKLK